MWGIRGAPLATLVLAVVGLVVGAVLQGGFFAAGFVPLAAIVVAAVVAALARGEAPSAAGRAVVVVAPLGAATVISAVFSDDPGNAAPTVALLVVLAAALATGLMVGRSGGLAAGASVSDTADTSDAVEAAMSRWSPLQVVAVPVGLVVGSTAWWGVAARATPIGRVTDGLWRGSSSLTYANAAAGLLAPLVLVVLAGAARHLWFVDPEAENGGFRSGAELRAAIWLALVGFVLLVGLGCTQSRAGLAAFGVGMSLWLVLEARNGARSVGAAVVTLLACGAPALAVVAVTVRSAPVESHRSLAVAAASLVCGAGVVVVLSATLRRLVSIGRDPIGRVATRRGFGLAMLSAIGIGVLFTAMGGWGDSVTRRLSVRSKSVADPEGPALVFGDRRGEWGAAWDRVGESPLVGHGPGVVDLRWTVNGTELQARFVHNEYLELAVTHGALGMAALGVGFVLLSRSLHGFTRRAPEVAAATACFAAHSSFDYLWHVPVLPVTMAVLVGLTAPPRTAPGG